VKGQRGDQRSDIYSLSVIFYEMLTGQPPFSGPNPLAVMNERVLNDPPPACKLRPEISPQLQEILYRALERDPRHRYATAQEMAWELEHQEQVGVDEDARRISLRGRLFPSARKLIVYTCLVMVPALLFLLMLLLAH
jgi:serine/threonine-protein kinase